MESKVPSQPSVGKKIIKTKLKEGIKKLPAQKPHLDFLAALLTIPVLLTIIYLNFQTINKPPTSPTPSTSPTKTVEIRYIPSATQNKIITPVIVTNTPQPTQPPACIKDIGPIDIVSPQEGQTVTNNPVCIDINYQAGNYCSVVWAYQINNSPLSDYSNNSVCLYNLPQGQNVFELHVKSLSSPSTKTLRRTFIYNGPTPTIQPTPTNAAPTSSK